MKSIKVLNRIRSLSSEPLKAACTYTDYCSQQNYASCSNGYDNCTYDYSACMGGADDSCFNDQSFCGAYHTDSCSDDRAGCCFVDLVDTCGVDTCGAFDF